MDEPFAAQLNFIRPLLVLVAAGLLSGCTREAPPNSTNAAVKASAVSQMQQDLEHCHDMIVRSWAYLEGQGTTPDVVVELERDDLLKRRDVVLETALQLLRKQAASE